MPKKELAVSFSLFSFNLPKLKKLFTDAVRYCPPPRWTWLAMANCLASSQVTVKHRKDKWVGVALDTTAPVADFKRTLQGLTNVPAHRQKG